MDQKSERHLFLEEPPCIGHYREYLPPPPLPIAWEIDLENIQSTLRVTYKEKSWKNSREIPNFL